MAPTLLCLHSPFEAQVILNPLATALIDGTRQISYEKLNTYSNSLTHYLLEVGLQENHKIGILMDCSLELAIAFIGISKAGAISVPLDTIRNKADLMGIIKDLGISLVLTRHNDTFDTSFLNEISVETLALDVDSNLYETTSHNFSRQVSADSIASIMHTTGTTGKPKGVTLSHRALCQEFLNPSFFGLDAGYRYLMRSPNIRSLFQPLWVGGVVVMANPYWRTNFSLLIETITQHNVMVMACPPSMLKALLDHPNFRRCQSLRKVYIGGEASSYELRQVFYNYFPNTSLFHTYATTETGTAALWLCRTTEDYIDKRIIGQQTPTAKLYLLNSSGQPVTEGEDGEIYIGGDGLALGYINDPTNTSNKFLSNTIDRENDARIYRTGDLGRLLPDGNIQFLGRVDRQVKIRGYRIELEAIENELEKHSLIKSAVVIVENRLGYDILSAYCSVTDTSISGNNIRDFLKNRLPEYMLPNTFSFKESLELLPNGKKKISDLKGIVT